MPKYNARRTEIDHIAFDSKIEGEYYRYLKQQQEEGKIKEFELQPIFTLQEGFRKNGKYYRPILYIADFKVYDNDGTVQIIDVKGYETADFKIKRKLFEKKYPFSLVLVKYVKKFGGWITVDEWKKLKKVKK
jgi:anaerobic selenocysteine-containing dehydrogenase